MLSALSFKLLLKVSSVGIGEGMKILYIADLSRCKEYLKRVSLVQNFTRCFTPKNLYGESE